MYNLLVSLLLAVTLLVVGCSTIQKWLGSDAVKTACESVEALLSIDQSKITDPKVLDAFVKAKQGLQAAYAACQTYVPKS